MNAPNILFQLIVITSRFGWAMAIIDRWPYVIASSDVACKAKVIRRQR